MKYTWEVIAEELQTECGLKEYEIEEARCLVSAKRRHGGVFGNLQIVRFGSGLRRG